jgi:hypothetical protein
MNLIVTPTFETIDCTQNHSEVVLFIYLGYSYAPYDFETLMLNRIKQNQNYKIFTFELRIEWYNWTYMLIKQMLRASDRIKIIFYSHLDVKSVKASCDHFTLMLHKLKLIQLPYLLENLGLVIFNSTSHEINFDWDACIFESYKNLQCATYGCPAIDILMNKDSNNSFTNIVLVNMSWLGEISCSSENELERLINERLQFTNLTSMDVDILHPETVRKHRDYHYHSQEYFYLMVNKKIDNTMSVMQNIKSISEFIETMEPHLKRQRRQIEINEEDDFSIHNKFESFMYNFNSNKFTERIRKGILGVLNDMDLKSFSKSMQAYCEYMCGQFTSEDVIMEEGQICPKPRKLLPQSSLHYLQQRSDFYRTFSYLLQRELFQNTVPNVKELIDNTYPEFMEKMIKLAIELTRNVCEQTFNRLIANFTFEWQPQMGMIEAPLNRWISDLTKWADSVPIFENETMSWKSFSHWIETRGINMSDINDNDIETMFEFTQSTERVSDIIHLQQEYKMKANFQRMIRELLYTFCRNVTSVATMKLATTKIKRVDALVAKLDQNFVEGLKKFHQIIDHEQWVQLRSQIFYHLTHMQQERQNFQHFLKVMEHIFGVHHFERPNAELARLQEINAEFDVYQTKLGRYINGSINTAQEWGKEFRESTEYIYRNSGGQPTSVINDAAGWIVGSEHRMSGCNFDGTLVLSNFFIQKWFQGNGKRNWWWPWTLIILIVLMTVLS